MTRSLVRLAVAAALVCCGQRLAEADNTATTGEFGGELFGQAVADDMTTFEFEVDLDAASKLKMRQYHGQTSGSSAPVDGGRSLEFDEQLANDLRDSQHRPGHQIMQVS